jgi:phage-related protein
MSRPQVTLTIGGDASGIERAFDRVGAGAKDMAGDLQAAEGKAKGFGSAMDSAGNVADTAEGKFAGTADVLDGLGGIMGVDTAMATGMMRAWSDLSGGFAAIQPLLLSVGTTLKTGVGGALSFIAAHPVLLTIAALTAAFVLLWQHSETFRDIVKGALNQVGQAFATVKNAFMGAFNWVKDNWPLLLAIITGPFGAAALLISKNFDTIIRTFKSTWNKVAGFISGLDFTINVPDILPGPSKYTIGLPDLPKFHSGGIVPGPYGAEVPIMAMAGETVIPRGRNAEDVTVVSKVYIDGREIHQALLRQQRLSGDLGLT